MVKLDEAADFSSARSSDFVIQSELGRNTVGVVLKAMHKSTGKIYALKKKIVTELETKKLLTNEVSLLQQLNHPNVIKCFGSFWDSDSSHLYIVLEYCDSGDLRGLINRYNNRDFNA